MNSSNGDLSFAMVIDTSDFDAGMEHVVEKTVAATDDIVSATDRIQQSLTDIPQVNLDFLGDVSGIEAMREAIGQAFAQIHGVIRQNETAIDELNQRYAQVTAEANKFANVPSMQKHYQELRQQQQAIKEVISVRQKAIAKAKEEEQALQKRTPALLKGETQVQQSLRQRIRLLEEEAAELVNAAELEGRSLDQTTGRYREIMVELGRLRDIRGDIQQAGSAFANDEAQIQGVIQGLSGLSGAFTAAQGVVGLFGSENEKLNEVMLRVQSLMAITMGLQQVQQMLNKDSTFSLVTLNAVKRMFGLHTKDNAEALAEENSKIAESIDNIEEETRATQESQATELADTAATQANTAAQNANASSQVKNAAMSKQATAQQNAHTGAMVAGTFATKAMAVATRALKMALISTGIGALVVLVGELIGWITELISAEDEASKMAEKMQEVHESGAESFAKASNEMKGLITRIDSFNSSAKQEELLLKEVNDKYGEQMGYFKSLDEAKDVLTRRGEKYCEMLRYEAEAQALLNEESAAYVEILRVQKKAREGEFDDSWWEFWNWGGKSSQDKQNEAIADAQSYHDAVVKQYEDTLKKAQAIREEYNFGGYTSPFSGSGGNNRPTYDPVKAAEEEKKLLEQFAKRVQDYIKQTNASISQAVVDSMEDGYVKEVNVLRKTMADRRRAWDESLKQLAEAQRESAKAVYMLGKDATEAGWAESDNGKRTIQDWITQLLADEKIRDNYEQGVRDIEAALNSGLQSIQDKYFSQLLNEFGDYNQRYEQLSLDWQKRLAFIGQYYPQFLDKAIEQMDEDFAALDKDNLKKNIDWEAVFGDLSKIDTSRLKDVKKQLKAFIDTNKELSPESLKELYDAIEKIDDTINERDPFGAMTRDFKSLFDATKQLKAAQDAYNKAVKEGNAAEIAAAKDALQAARDAKQETLGSATDSLKAAMEESKQIMEAVTALSDMFAALGVDIPEQLTGLLSGFGETIDALGSIDLTKPFSIISGGLKAITGVIKGIGALFNNDASREKEIEHLQGKVDALQRSYDALSDAIDEAYGKDASRLINQQNTMLRQQQALIRQQIAAEESKKDSDTDRIQEWQNALEDIEKQIVDNEKAAIDAIFGADLKSAIEQFADAYAEAWSNGEDRAKSAKDTVRQMMQQMVQESIRAAIQASGAMERIRRQLEQFYADNVLSQWEQDYILGMAEQLQEQLDQQFGWAESLLNGDEREAAQRGIATASQESVDENNARLTTIQSHTYTLVQGVAELNATGTQILERLTSIDTNTDRTADAVAEVQADMRRLRNSIDDITTQGIRIK